jgi:RNA 3'-terminal phosphate cyclase (ATP)
MTIKLIDSTSYIYSMIIIDGSIGGGQLLRTAIGLSALTLKPVKIINIRKGKGEAKPGLRPQHMMGIKIAGEFCDAEIRGLKEYSLEVEFIPKKLELKDKRINIGTAGSVSLLLQTLAPILIFGKKSARLEIIGGTDTAWAPPIDYLKKVTFPLLEKMGADLKLEVLKYGFYPKGGGRVIVESKPTKRLNSFNCLSRGKIEYITIDSVSGSLPPEVAERQAKSALRTLQYHYPDIKISASYRRVETLSPGSSITCVAVCENSILGGNCLGERGLRAEIVGQRAAESLINSLESEAALDRFMADQILVFLALAKGESRVRVEEITEHCRTNIQVIEEILPVEFNIHHDKREIFVKGIDFNG